MVFFFFERQGPHGLHCLYLMDKHIKGCYLINIESSFACFSISHKVDMVFNFAIYRYGQSNRKPFTAFRFTT